MTDRQDQQNGMSSLGWFLAGLGFGALAGVLYAPKAGKETREELMASALDAKEKATAYAQQQIDRANELVAQGKQQAAVYADKGREFYEQGRNQWTEYVEKGKGLVHEHQEKVVAAFEAGKEAYIHTAGDHQA